MVKPYCRAVVGTVVGVATICGSAAAFVVGNAVTGRIASGRARPMMSSVSDSAREFDGQVYPRFLHGVSCWLGLFS